MLFVFLLLLAAHALSGFGVLCLFRIRLAPLMQLALSVIMGIVVAAMVPFVLELCRIPLNTGSVFGAWAFVLLLLLLPVVRMYRSAQLRLRWPFSYELKVYELPFVLFTGFVLLVALWRCYYVPSASRDFLSGAEVLAEFTLKEGTMINSVYSINLESTNNPFKSPFLTTLQVIYKMAGFPLGALWLGLLSLSFTVFLYALLRSIVHPLIAGLLCVLFSIAPELYAYSYMVLYDYSNMVFFFLGVLFLQRFLVAANRNELWFSALLFGIATYIRAETLGLVLLLAPLLFFAAREAGHRLGLLALRAAALIWPSVLAYWLVAELYNNHYLPVHYEVGNLVNNDLANLQPLWARFGAIWSRLLTGKMSAAFYGYIFYLAVPVLAGSLLYTRRWRRDSLIWLYAAVAVIAGLALLGFLLPLVDIMNTTKRGFFKLVPLLLCGLATTPLLQLAAARISSWETGREKTGTAKQS